ncbi:hypothetical protein BDV3_005070 [Batrachochytrium dendrobatidis]|uniref:Folylpolyglutamate synthase n=2 Tax=Batrachochytrium dendrobatidis (strain JEL423) TaxID=403673 RepID=A0A177WMK0_BATDL|nr:hypothetical protein BDEG_24313 [Batrachochytrium dendrobatidis JEL423]
MTRDYATAIQLLNSLQSNANVLDAIRKSGNLINTQSLPEFRNYVMRIGYTAKDFDKLAIIHIAGTKGKGSTSAFCDSILRQTRIANSDGTIRPLKTGMYTSPHLQEVRERIRINGAPVTKEQFAKHFFSVWDKLEQTKPAVIDQKHSDKPFYFRYLTLMSFELFLEENVDVVILEVGVGGEFDSTNVIEKPVVCGISSLGYDHVAILGNTIEKIAWHKAGIIKPGSPVVTSPQLPDAMTTIKKRAEELKASKVIEISEESINELENIKLGLHGSHQRTNGALAREICKQWISSREASGLVFKNDPDYITHGLESASWPGRCQRIQSAEFKDIEWFVDGAHTPESLQVCADWFKTIVLESTDAHLPTYLVFNCTHGRDPSLLLLPLVKVFQTSSTLKGVVFCTNDPFSPSSVAAGAGSSDLTNNMVHADPEHKVQQDLARAWAALAKESSLPEVPITVMDSVESAAKFISTDRTGKKQVLVTGSLHLVGSVMTLLHAEVV